jgi:uncharacterized protein
MSGFVQPLRQFVLKVHSRCDLACDHCYVYEQRDQSWRRRPMVLSLETAAWTAKRIAEHAKAHRLVDVRVVLHGGEPLLAGVARLREIAQTLRDALAGVCELDLRLHTNGVRLDETFLDMFAEQRIGVGVSVDGPGSAHDRHRRYADGRGSHADVAAALDLLRREKYRGLYAGLLCTIDLANDPVEVYESLVAFDPPKIDFLLPHATWDHPPYRPPGKPTAYADWLLRIHQRWAEQGRPVGIRLFDSIVSTSLGGPSYTEAIGLDRSDLVVVETDGTYEQADSLKTAFDGAPVTGLDVTRHDLDQVARHPAIAARQQGLAGLCARCRSCPVVGSCGGGLYAHRHKSGTGFANPSVFCPDLFKLITVMRTGHVRQGAPGASQPVHSIPGPDLDELARGYGGETAIGHLRRAQRSLRRALIAAVHEAADTTRPAGLAASDTAAAWELLTRVDGEHPEAVDAVLAHPYIRAWAAGCLGRLRLGYPAATPGRPTDGPGAGHLCAIAAAAAIRGGVPARIEVPVTDGWVNLPSLGRFSAAGAASDRRATIEVRDAAFDVGIGGERWTVADLNPAPGKASAGPRDRWQPVRSLAAPGFDVVLEDTDPYRACYQQPPAGRLGARDVARWERELALSWDMIRTHHAAYAPGLAAGLTTITPLSPGPAGRDISGTARQAFGAIAIALPEDHVKLSLLLLHEFQHVKLGAILDLYDLYDQADGRLFRVRWRPDARPLEGVLQGTYAHVTVADFWRTRRHLTTGEPARAAAEMFGHWRDGAAEAIDTLAGSGSLTPLGQRFVEGMRATVTPWLDEPAGRAGTRRISNIATDFRAQAVHDPGPR